MPAVLDIRRYRSLPSTMDAAASLAQEGAAHGVVVVADEQSAGRGRRGTHWASPPGAGLYFSFIARPTAGELPSPLLTLAAGVGVRNGMAAVTGFAPDLKWPNDLIVGNRKLAGILAEGLAVGTPAQAVIIGVGINVTPGAYPPDVAVRATSIEGELGRPVDSDAVLQSVLTHLRDALDQLDTNPGDILRSWRAASPCAIGTRVEREGRSGVTAGVDEGGALLVKTAAGIERIIAGELTWHLGT